MIEIGRKYEIINSVAGNNGVIVTVTGYLGTNHGFNKERGPRWYIDTWVNSTHGYKINHMGEKQLKPINDGNEVITWESMRDLWIPEDLEQLA